MGAITFSLDERLVASLKAILPLDRFVETGTFKGDTLAEMRPHFKELVSIELSDTLWQAANARFKDTPHITILQGDSTEHLHGLAAEGRQQGTLYWLDAHWCAADATAGEISQCPLLGELQAIGTLPAHSVILIDDARLFLAPPSEPHEISQWPDFDAIITKLRNLSTTHKIFVINDVIAFVPPTACKAMVEYARAYGTDWLLAAHRMREYATFIRDYEAKETVIKTLAAERKALLQTLANKELVIEQLAYSLRHYRRASRLLKPVRKARALFKRLFAPRLGQLYQYTGQVAFDSRASKPVIPTSYPTISIVTPSFRQGDYIERTLRSVLDQNYPALELFVQDGGSADSTVEVLKRYEDRLLGWESKRDDGQSQAINLGFAHTSGEIMAYLNSDDLLLPHTLAIVADYFNRHPDVDVVYGDRLLIDANDLEIGRWIMPGHDSEVLSWADYVPQETMFWRRNIWDKAGGRIDESFRFAMDWDLIIRFREAGAVFAHIPRFLGAFRIHEQQKTSAAITATGFAEMNRIRERIHGRPVTRYEIRKATARFMLWHIGADLAFRIRHKLQNLSGTTH